MVYSEELSADAVRIRSRYRLIAPELLLAECANILWKKVRRGELADHEAIVSAAALERAGVELVPIAALATGAIRLALELGIRPTTASMLNFADSGEYR